MTMDKLQSRIEKFRLNTAHFDYLINRGFNSIEIMDRMIHEMLSILREGLKNKYPNHVETEISKLMREISERMLYLKLKKLDLKDYGI